MEVKEEMRSDGLFQIAMRDDDRIEGSSGQYVNGLRSER